MGYRAGKITVENGSPIVIGTGTEWADPKHGVLPNTILKGPDGSVYELESVVSNGKLILHEPYSGPSAENQSYSIFTTYIGDMSQFAAQFNALLEYYRATQQNMRDVLTGTGNVDVKKDDGTVVPVPAFSNAMLKGQFGWGGKAVRIDAGVNLFDYFTVDRPAGLYWADSSTINKPPGFTDAIYSWEPIVHPQFYGALVAVGFTDGGSKTASVSVSNGVWENQWTVYWNTRNLNPATTDTNQEIHALKTFMANWASLIIKPEGMGQPSYLQGNDFDGSTRWTCGYQDINANHLTLRNNKAGVAMTMHADRKIYASCDDFVLTDAKGFVRNARALEYSGGGEFGEFLKSQQSAGSAPVAGVWRAFVSVRHRGGNSNQEPGSDSTQWGWALVDNNMTQGNFNEFVLEKTFNGTWLNAVTLKHTGNTTVDANGFLKTASPIVKLFADGSSELNAESDGVVTTRISEGVYHITGCLGLNADRAWGGDDGGITNPKCRNGYERIWNDYEVQEDGSLIIRTYHRVHSDAMPFAQNRLNLNHRQYDEKRDSEEWPDRALIDIPLGTYLTVRVQMPASDETRYSPSPKFQEVKHSNIYCGTTSPAGQKISG
ncbi:hypothetical protein H2Y56_21900 [Pectobacterium aroidearum]|uniref:Phage tail protein C-terminal domain-containing protein n=1 Tax=Pectobacterium aroidearum TaxID=1201031 RepID=A0ABR5ZJT2_9GAMM|nr:hypothetical protein [Pectobacterium aroidearum]MBA5234737.1 hypothetical protein [Pectobacterium aroidearum]MBA5739915.1 hypothetical protein [Pectobacterium aroidearum]